MHAGLHAGQIRGVLVEHEADRLVAVPEMLVPRPLRRLLAVRHELEGPDVVEHPVRIGRMRPLPEQHQVVRMHVQRDVRKYQVVVVVGELVIVEP